MSAELSINWFGTVALVPVSYLLPTEDFNEERVHQVMELVTNAGEWTRQVALERESLVIMDGHHRFEVAKRLNLRVMPCSLLSYDEVEVTSRRDDISFTKEDIINRGIKGLLFPEKTTRHIFRDDARLACRVPLSLLR